MLDPQTYRTSEQLAKSLIPSWRVSQIHNVDLFERVGFPVRINSVRELGQIVDTMQENRFERYMAELGGLSDAEYSLILGACKDVVRFQLSYLPHRPPVLPISTLLSAFAIYKKLQGAIPDFRSVLEIGPGCGYVSFFLKHHAALANYSQIEACESFYIFQNLVNLYCFGPRLDERALPPENLNALDYFTNTRAELEMSPGIRVADPAPLCTHYPWWRIGELVTRNIKFDVVTSNANLLEFNPPALDDYLSLMHQTLKPEGVFMVQCTGFEASGTPESLLDKIHKKGFAPLMFVREAVPASWSKEAGRSETKDFFGEGTLPSLNFTTNNAVFIRSGHPLFEKYYDRKNYHLHFISPEPLVRSMYFDRPAQRRMYSLSQFVEDTEAAFRNPADWNRGN